MAAANPRSVEASGKTVDDAVLQALRRLGLSRGQVEVSVITEGRPGVFGIGATEARVHVSAIGAGRDDSDDDAAPLPKIDDYADYAEVDRRPAPTAGVVAAARPAGAARLPDAARPALRPPPPPPSAIAPLDHRMLVAKATSIRAAAVAGAGAGATPIRSCSASRCHSS